MQKDEKTIISLIVPCFNEEENIEFSYQTITNFWKNSQINEDYQYQIVFIDDGSTDKTINLLRNLEAKDKNVIVVELAKNFGKEIAVSAGYFNCTGEAAIIVDADMQYPIDKLPEFIEKWEEGYDVVIGMRDYKKTNNLIEKWGSKLFYAVMDRISEVKVLSGALDFRLIDRQVIEAFNKFTERGRTARVLIDWLGYKRTFINYAERERQFGEASYSFKKRLFLALNSFVSHSFFPMEIVGYLGVIITSISLPVGVFLAIQKYFLNDMFGWNISGVAHLAILNLFFTGIILASLGLISYYIATIQKEVINRPLFVVRKNRKRR